ncbi:uncharacterized protein V1510DRAFT_429785 [Dipodascopsis tothii]|uniref:uncharacterized protein n=1 Tax=Dipodascopsis tothii TaxID=44089 RepID=UPI0034CF7250
MPIHPASKAIIKACFILSAQLPVLHSYPLVRRDDDDDDDDDEANFWLYMSVSIVLVLLGGVFAGLTLGLMGQDEVYLQVIEQSGSPSEQKSAQKVLQLLKRGKHWVLVTMLLSNVITNETLPIVLDRCLGGGWPAVVSSTVAIVIFGEIIPQSVSVRYGLGIGAMFSPFVLFLMYAMYPVAYPTALLLDYVLGEDHGTVYRKAQLKTLVTLHRSMGVERLNRDEVTIISAVLDLNEKPVKNIMTPIEDVYTMSADRILDQAAVDEILKAGYSRIPIHTPNEPFNFIGMLLVRILISYDPEDAQPVSTFPLATLPETRPDTTCLNVLNYFQEGKSHMMLVSEYPGEAYGAIGVLTLEDVIEELIGEEIVDESDVYVDIAQGIRRKYLSPMMRRTLPSEFVVQQLQNPSRLSESTPGNYPMVNVTSPDNLNSPLLGDGMMSTSAGEALTTGASLSPISHFHSLPGAPSPLSSIRVNPVNLALHPNKTNNSKVTIKRGAMEDYVRRASMDKGYTQGGAKHGPPQGKTGFGTIHESEWAAIADATLTATAPVSKPAGVSRTNSLTPDAIDLGRSPNTNAISSSNASVASSHRKNSAYELEALTSRNEFRDNRDLRALDGAENFHASGIIESVREVHGFRKTIIESTALTDDDDSSISSLDSCTSSATNRSGRSDRSGSSGRGNAITGYRRHRKGKSVKDRRTSSNSKEAKDRGGRKGSFFSDHGVVKGIIGSVTGNNGRSNSQKGERSPSGARAPPTPTASRPLPVSGAPGTPGARPERPERSTTLDSTASDYLSAGQRPASSNGSYTGESRPLLG